LASLFGVKIDLIDLIPLFTQLVNNPASFGFKNSTGEAYNPSTHKEVKHPNQYVFWDGFHPTKRVHLLAAQMFEKDASANVILLGSTP
jgi:phospholipase/lecithinase/hemolysin